ncbi:MAG: type II toxin-antitoxin system Phd/YefM family antitoxin [Candidatus Dormibacteria bacterium]
MKRVGAYEARTHLAALLDEVVLGERITITRHGVAVAMIVPPGEVQVEPSELIDRIRKLRAGKRLGEGTIRELIDEGRRF